MYADPRSNLAGGREIDLMIESGRPMAVGSKIQQQFECVTFENFDETLNFESQRVLAIHRRWKDCKISSQEFFMRFS